MKHEAIKLIVDIVIDVCQSHADFGHFDKEGAIANSMRIVNSEVFLKTLPEAALSPAKQEWVSVKERLPESLKNVQVIWYRKEYGDFVTRGFHVAECWSVMSWDGKITGATVTHWRKLPALPYTEEK